MSAARKAGRFTMPREGGSGYLNSEVEMIIYQCDVCRCQYFNPLGIVDIPYMGNIPEAIPMKKSFMVCRGCGTKIVNAIEKIKEDLKNDVRSKADA
jgi:hypothetical protein